MTSNLSQFVAKAACAAGVFLIAVLGGSVPVLAQDALYDPQSGAPTRYQAPHTGILNGKFWTDFRYRYETVDQANFARDAHASTLRNKTGVESGFFHGFRAGVEGEFVVEIGPDDFNNTINGRTEFPVVVDVESAEVDQAYLESHNIPGVALLGGRYLENLDNLRFVGSVAWRQNDQTFDGAKATITAIPGVTALYAYIGNVNRIFSDSSPIGNIHSNIHLMHLQSEELSFGGKLTAYTYLIDLYDLDFLSNASYGGFLKGKQPLNDAFTYKYRFEYAHQTDYGHAPIDYGADYVRVEQGLAKGGFTGTLVYELLGSDNGIAAFQTPLATGHIFNGFADVFLVTPPDGLQDFYVEAKYKMADGSGPFGAFGGLLLLAQYHEFRSAVGSIDYGSEFDFYAYLPLRDGFYAQAKFADYRADAFFVDIQKLIFGLGYQY